VSEPAPSLDQQDRGVATLAVAAGGVVALLLGWILDLRILRWLGLVASLAGGGLLVRDRLAQRDEKIASAEGRIRSELDDLDPLARARVLEDVVRSGEPPQL
jgi:hypothetical protein